MSDTRIPFHVTLLNAQRRHILCMKWGTKYGPEYVNRLYAMVRRHLGSGFRFTCLTDDPQGIRSEVECRPIPPLDLPEGTPERGPTKLVGFAADLYGLRGTALFLDLDVVIVGGLDPFFEYPGKFLVIEDYKRRWRWRRRVTGDFSVCRFEIGAHPDVLEHFRNNVAEVSSTFRNEQAYVSDFLHRQGKLGYWPAAWCPSFKHHSIPRWPSNYWRAPFVPSGARIVVFQGECNPPGVIAGRRNRSLRFVHSARWVTECWREWLGVVQAVRSEIARGFALGVGWRLSRRSSSWKYPLKHDPSSATSLAAWCRISRMIREAPFPVPSSSSNGAFTCGQQGGQLLHLHRSGRQLGVRDQRMTILAETRSHLA